jgi:DNA polymerase-3 subunit epsilon
VYYLKGQHGHTLYVGKANNIQQRVASHFTGAGASARKQLLHRLVHHVTYRRTHHEYMALLLEDAEIQRLKPPFNVAQKQKPGAHSVTLYTDRSGYVRPAVVPGAGLSTAVASFSSRHQAHSWLLSHLLQSDMPYLVPGSEHPWPTPEVHRSRMSTFAERLTPAYPTPTLLLCPTGESDVPFALFQNGCCAGMGYAPHTATPGNLYLDYMHPTPDTATARMVVQRMYQDPEIVKVPLTPTL